MLLEPDPNLVPDLPLTKSLLDRRRCSLESYARYGFAPGLRRAEDGGASMQLAMETQDTLHLKRLRAVGMRGHPLIVDSTSTERSVGPFDTSRLGVGRYDLYLCLENRMATGGEVREFRPPGSQGMRRYEIDRYPVLSLCLDDERLPHRDWLKVASFQRLRSGGIVRTHLDSDFHPPVLEMGAYLGVNPLPALAEQLHELASGDAGDPLAEMLRYESATLLALADRGEPATVFTQIHRCLALAKGMGLQHAALDANLVGICYSPDSFCRLIWDLHRSLKGHQAEPYPPVLEIDGVRHLRCDDEFHPEGKYWVWRPSRSEFVASSVVLYIPRAVSGMPFLHYGHHVEEAAHWSPAEVGNDLSHPGIAITMEGIQNRIDALYLRTGSANEAQHLREQLGEGHAIYYR